LAKDKVKLTGRNLAPVISSRNGRSYAMHLLCNAAILPNLELKTQPKQLLGSILLNVTLPMLVSHSKCSGMAT